jgi:hypothetical protein
MTPLADSVAGTRVLLSPQSRPSALTPSHSQSCPVHDNDDSVDLGSEALDGVARSTSSSVVAEPILKKSKKSNDDDDDDAVDESTEASATETRDRDVQLGGVQLVLLEHTATTTATLTELDLPKPIDPDSHAELILRQQRRIGSAMECIEAEPEQEMSPLNSQQLTQVEQDHDQQDDDDDAAVVQTRLPLVAKRPHRRMSAVVAAEAIRNAADTSS